MDENPNEKETRVMARDGWQKHRKMSMNEGNYQDFIFQSENLWLRSEQNSICKHTLAAAAASLKEQMGGTLKHQPDKTQDKTQLNMNFFIWWERTW